MNPQAVIFDMDGLLIDSEPLWRQAEQEIFPKAGITLTEAMCYETTGLSTKEVVEYWYAKMHINRDDVDEMASAIENRVVQLVKEKGESLPGVYSLLNHCQKLGIRCAVASGSPDIIINAVLEKLDIRNYIEFCHSAEHEKAGKPDPSVYLATLKKLQLPARDCIAFEDSVRGSQAAMAAGIFTISVPEQGHSKLSDFDFTDITLTSLDQALSLPCLQQKQKFSTQ